MMVTTSVSLVRPLTEGGMGSVWLAQHEGLHTQVVVKFISAEFGSNQDAKARFSREASAAAQVKSPHVVQTLDHGLTADGVPYIVMEYLEGRDLGDHLEIVKRMPPRDVAEVVTQLSRALEKAHSRGIVHRDIKPNNVFLCDAGDGNLFVKLLDFGIAKVSDLPKIDSTTKTGAVMGSPFYMSPEQVVGSRDVDLRTDLWSLGVVAFEALTGRRPFDAETVGGLAVKIHSDPLPVPSAVDPSLGPAIDAWFARACARAPAERFGSAKEMSDALIGAVTGEAPQPISLGTGPRSAHPPSIDFAKTDLDPRTATDAGLGLQTSPDARKGTARGVALGLGVAILLGALAFGGARLVRGEHPVGVAAPEPVREVPTASAHPAAPAPVAPSAAPAPELARPAVETAAAPSASAATATTHHKVKPPSLPSPAAPHGSATAAPAPTDVW